MSWDSTKGLLKKPVRMDEIASALGLASLDLGTLARSASRINLMSRRKPTQYTGLDSPDPAQPRGADSVSTDYYDGTKSYGVAKTYMSIPDGQYHPGDTAASLRGDLGYMNLVPNLTSQWGQATLSKYRMLDFDGYVDGAHLNYPDCGGSKPYIVSSINMQINGNTANFGALVRYDYNDVILTEYTMAGLLGLRSLFGLDAFSTDTPAYLGVMMYAPLGSTQTSGRLDRTVPLVALAIKTGTQLGTTDNAEDYNTGDSRMILIQRTIPADRISSSLSDQTSHFLNNECVRIFPVLCRRNTSNTGWNLFTFAYNEAPRVLSKVLTTGSVPQNYTSLISSASIKYTVNRESNGNLVFYLANDQDFVVATSGNYDRLYFGEAGIYTLQAGPGDGSSVVEKIGQELLGTSYDDSIWERRYSPRTASMISSQLIYGYNSSTPYASRAGTFILKPYASASTFKIGVRVSYWSIANGVGSAKVLTGNATVNANIQSGSTITVTLT